jgi:tetratricopeptide (TPR) repeat protein
MIALLAILLTPFARADDTADTAQQQEQQTDIQQDTVTGKKPPPIAKPIPAPSPAQPESGMIGMYPATVVRSAKALNVDVAMLNEAYVGVQALYARDYKKAKSTFDGFDAKYPDTGIAAMGNVLVWQAMMLENFDFKYEAQYQASYRRARQQLEQALQIPGNEAWEQFLLGGLLGVDAISTMRKGDFVKALNRGYEAMKSIERCEELAPDFIDARLGNGLYQYWRSVVTLNSKVLPAFGDHRAQGIAAIQEVEAEGTFLGPAATLALVFTWLEEVEYKKALASALVNYRAYPSNVINDLVVGRTYYYVRDYANSERVFHEVQQIAPENNYVYYNLASLYTSTKDYPRAQEAIDKYLTFDLTNDFAALGWYKKGNIHYAQQQYKDAEVAYEQALKLDGGMKRAKAGLDRVKKINAEGG